MTLEETEHELFFPLLMKFCAIMSAAESDDDEKLNLALSKAIPLYKKIERTKINVIGNEREWRLGV